MTHRRDRLRRTSAFQPELWLGAKLHIIYDCDAERPIDAAITPARLNTSPPPRLCWIATARLPTRYR